MKRFKIFYLILLFIVICCFITIIKVRKNIYYEPKLYPVLDENNRPSYACEVENPRVELLTELNKGIVLELVDTSGCTVPFRDTFYCVLTNDRKLHYYNGYIKYFLSGYTAIDEFNLNDMEKKGRVFEFQVLNKEYSVKITYEQYKKILSMIDNINETFYPSSEEMFPKISDYNVHKGLCIKTGYFDGREGTYIIPKKDNQSQDNDVIEEKYMKMFDEIYSYVQGLIPNLKPYNFGQNS